MQLTLPIKYDLEWQYSVSLEQIKKDIEAIEALGATHVEIRSEVFYDCATLSIDAVCEREETAEEEAKRLNLQMAKKEAEIQQEIETLKRLRAKYPQCN